MKITSLDITALHAAYANGLAVTDLIREIYRRIAARGEDAVWIYLIPEDTVLLRAYELEKRRAAGESLPLYGVPFAVKDNIDVAGLPTTAACPDFIYQAKTTATAVQHLLDAGAVLIGKTNLDQFATGLVGTRSPYGAPSCVFDKEYISGGSSAGSAVSVAAGLVSFSLGTDTAGSGRVPASFNNIVGWKPTKGLVSTTGLLPACRSLDCISVFSLTCGDAQRIAEIMGAYDEADPYSRPKPATGCASLPAAIRFGVPQADQLAFFGDAEAADLFAQSIARLEKMGGVRVEIDFEAFCETARLLYEGPWVAERYAAISELIRTRPEVIHPVTLSIIRKAENFSAEDTFRSFYRLEELRRKTQGVWDNIDVMLIPTAGTIYRHAEVTAQPVQTNTNLGFYTNFVNLLDLCGLAVPAGFRPNGLPFGVTLLAPAFTDGAILELGVRVHEAIGGNMGATGYPLPKTTPVDTAPCTGSIALAVVGAHLSGQPLNYQLTDRDAVLLRTTKTAPAYRLYALDGTVPPKPGLVRAPDYDGNGIEVEVWALSSEAFGQFVAEVPAPLAIGNLELEDGSTVKGFVCEPFSLKGSSEITDYGGWRAYLGSKNARHEGIVHERNPSNHVIKRQA